MTTKFIESKDGKSYVVPIPDQILKKLGLKEKDKVSVEVSFEKIVIKPLS